MKILRRSEFNSVPWKNGGGITHEIAKKERRGKILWRLSIAEVGQDAPFSLFEGLHRSLTVIAGNGMDLRDAFGNLAHSAAPMQPIAFSGNEVLAAVLRNGPCADFNLIFDPQFFEGRVDILSGKNARTSLISPNNSIGLLCLGESMACNGRRLERHDLVFLGEADGIVELSSPSEILRVTLKQL